MEEGDGQSARKETWGNRAQTDISNGSTSRKHGGKEGEEISVG